MLFQFAVNVRSGLPPVQMILRLAFTTVRLDLSLVLSLVLRVSDLGVPFKYGSVSPITGSRIYRVIVSRFAPLVPQSAHQLCAGCEVFTLWREPCQRWLRCQNFHPPRCI